MKRNALMYCCRGEDSASHKRRALEVARKMSDGFHVTILLDESTDEAVEIPDGVNFVNMPAFSTDPDSDIFDISRSSELRERLIIRRNLMLTEFERLKPRVVVVESFPFKQHRLQGEVLPLIERARNGVYGESLVVSVTDGIVIARTVEKETHADMAARFLEKYFDLVLVQSDPVFARLEEFFQPKHTVNTPLYHTGFVTQSVPGLLEAASSSDDSVLVSAGDGHCGAPLFRAAIEAHKILWPSQPLPMKIITGERLPDDDWNALVALAENAPSLTLAKNSADLSREMANARWSISQCGYNTATNAILTGTPSLFVPCPDVHREEQIVRAQRLVYWGAGRLLMPHHLNGASLANEIHELTKFEPRQNPFDLDGASNAAYLISEVVYNNNYAPVGARSFTDYPRPH